MLIVHVSEMPMLHYFLFTPDKTELGEFGRDPGPGSDEGYHPLLFMKEDQNRSLL